MGFKKLLIVDDSEDFRSMLKDHLKRHDLGIEIFEASSGEMGVAKAACIRPDVVLMDINLPRASGFEATRHIKNDCPKCEVIILTMFEVKSFKEMAQQIKALDFIGKSEIGERLVPALKKYLMQRKMGEERTRK